MANLSEDIQCAGLDTRPPMLDRTDFASWQQRIRLYCQGKDNGVNILKSIDEGPFQMGTFWETLSEGNEGALHLGPERPRVYSDLLLEEKERYNADIRATNILLQRLPKYIYTLINHYTDAKDIWNNVKMLLKGSELTKKDHESRLYDDYEHFRQHKGETIHDYYVRFAKLINDMRNIKMTMSRMQLNSKFVNNMLPERCRLVTTVKLNKGLRDSNYDQLYAYLKQHEAHANEDKMMLDRLTQHTVDPLSLMSNVSHQQYYLQSSTTPPSTFVQPHFADNTQLDLRLSLTDNLIENLTNTLSLLTQSYQTYLPQTNNQLKISSNTRNQAIVQDGRVVVQNVQGRQNRGQGNNIRGAGAVGYEGAQNRVGNANLGQARVALNEEQLLFIAGGQDNAVDEDVDGQSTMFMANLSSADPVYDEASLSYDLDFLSEVHDHDHYQDAVFEHHEVHEMHDDVQPNYVVDLHANYTSDSNMIPYDQYVQAALYNGHEIIKTNHVSTILHNLKETLEIAEITRKKMNDKIKDPECVKKKVKIAPHDYSKENYLATFTPQKQLTPEQIFWSKDLLKMKEEALKEQTTASRPIKALTVYPPNTSATLIPGKHNEIGRKNLLIPNNNLIADCLSKDVFYTATNYALTISRFFDMHAALNAAQKRIAKLESKNSNLKNKIQNDDHDVMIKHFSKLELKHLNLQLKYQHLKEIFENKKSVTSSDTPTFDSVFVIGQLKDHVQSRGNTIRELREKIYRLTKKHSDADPIHDLKALNSQNKELHAKVNALHNLNKRWRLAPGMYVIVVEPVPPRNRNSREVCLDYLKHLKKSVATLCEIVEEARVEKPLDSSLAYACLYTKHSQELVEYVIGTCLNDFNKGDKQIASTPITRKKRVTFIDPCETSTNNTLTHIKQQTMHQTNEPVIPSIRVKVLLSLSGQSLGAIQRRIGPCQLKVTCKK
nr:retrovirus-related Pol polyprotein from transposon TNT 1-94 [Tanacetum cinerariifolium]